MKRCHSQKETDTFNSIIWPFWLQACDTLLIPFIIWWSFTPTNVLNSNSSWKMLESIGTFGARVMIFTGIPFGVIGLVKARKMSRLRIATRVMSVVNICTGVLIPALLIWLLYVATINA